MTDNETETDFFGSAKRFFKKNSTEVDTPLTQINRDADFYNMNHFRRGTAVIFNHYEFDQGLVARGGTKKDAADLEAVLIDLKFNVFVYNDLKYGAIYDVVTNLSKEDHSDADCLLITVLSHGDVGKIHARDHQYPPDILWKPFAGDKCPSLAGKPKLFFIQACRGDEVDDGARVRAVIKSDSKIQSYTIPAMADILIMFSCFDGYFSWRCPKTGSWFIQSLCEELKLRARRDDLLTILTFLNRRMAITYQSIVPNKSEMHQKKQIGTVVSTLTRLLYFYPRTQV